MTPREYCNMLWIRVPMTELPRIYDELTSGNKWPEALGEAPGDLTDKEVFRKYGWPLMKSIENGVGRKAVLRYFNKTSALKLMDDQLFDDWWECNQDTEWRELWENGFQEVKERIDELAKMLQEHAGQKERIHISQKSDGGAISAQDFGNTKTDELFRTLVCPALEQWVREEYWTQVLVGCEMTEDDKIDLDWTEQKMEKLVCGYLRALMRFYLDFGETYNRLAKIDMPDELDDVQNGLERR